MNTLTATMRKSLAAVLAVWAGACVWAGDDTVESVVAAGEKGIWLGPDEIVVASSEVDFALLPPLPVVDPVSPKEEPRLLYENAKTGIPAGEAVPYASAVTVYDGYLVDDDGAMKGSVQVKVAKAAVNKKTGETAAKVTATVQLVGSTKKLSFKGGFADMTGAVTSMSAGGHTLDVSLGAGGLGGSLDGVYAIDGARNFFSARDSDGKALASAAENAYVGAYNVVCREGVLSVTVAKKGKAKIAGTWNGAKATATGQLLVGDEACCVPVVIAKANIAFVVWLLPDGSVEVVGVDVIAAGRAGTLGANMAFRLDAAAFSAILGLLGDYLPNGLSVSLSGTKWVVAGGAKAGKVAIDRRTGEIDEAKLGANPSGLKLAYVAKTGSFKGSFKAYALEKGRIKAYTVNVEGVMVGDTGYGTATLKKPAVSCPVTVE